MTIISHQISNIGITMKPTILVISLIIVCELCDCKANVTSRNATGAVSKYGRPLYLTPLINAGQIQRAKRLAKVRLDTPRDIESYSGFFTVNKKYNSTLFHWYFVAEETPFTSPVLLWLNGGPGTSSLLGLFQEHGPFYVEDTNELELREYYWSKNHHVIYLDSPVGTGYSYTDSEEGYARNTDDVAKNVYEAMQQFFLLFPELKNNDFFLTGESYAGKYIPGIAHRIIKYGGFPNFKGVAIGNGLTDPLIQSVGIGEYLYQQGFIDDRARVIFQDREKLCYEVIKTITETDQANRTEPENPLGPCREILDPFSNDTLFAQTTGYSYVYNILESRAPVEEDIKQENFLDQPIIRKAIHVGNLKRYADPLKIQKYLGVSLLMSEKSHIEELLAKKYRVLIYSGELDVIFPYVITVNYLKSLNFTHINDYLQATRHVWQIKGEVAGYLKSAGTLTEAMVIGAGHMVPLDQPDRAWNLITKFTRNKLPKTEFHYSF